MYKAKTIGVVVPAYNEEGFVGEVIETMPDFVDRVYVVDDGSTDGTWDEIKRYAKKQNSNNNNNDNNEFDRCVVPIQHEENKGEGAARKTGYLQARDDEIDVVAAMDGDGQMDPDYLDKLIDPIVEEEADYSKGNRLAFWEYRQEMSKGRFLGNALLTFLTKIASGYWKMMDPQNGYTAISNTALENVRIEDMYEYYGYCNDLLVKLNTEDMTVADVSIPAVYGQESSHIRYREYVVKVSLMLMKNFFWRMKKKYLLLDFHPLALFYFFGGGLAGFGALTVIWSLFRKLFHNEAFYMRGMLGLVVFTLGSILIMFAMLYDMQVNQDNEIQVH